MGKMFASMIALLVPLLAVQKSVVAERASASSLDEPHRAPTGDLSDWTERATDSIRQDILKGRFLEAWRSTQLMRRTRTPLPDLAYYEKLAILLAGACPFDLAVKPVAFDHLLSAYGARFYRKFSSGRSDVAAPMEASDSGVSPSSLTVSQVPFLTDIRATKLVRGAGCRFARPRFRNATEAEWSELTFLLKYIKRVEKYPEERPAGDVRARVRLLELATRANVDELKTRLLAELVTFDAEPWLAMAEQDRRFLWSVLQTTSKVPHGMVKEESAEDLLIEKIILHSSSDEVGYWLALAPMDQWSVARRKSVYEKVDALGPFPGRNAIILRRALIEYEAGRPREALEFIRRILMTATDEDALRPEGDTQSDETEAYALKLVEALLSQYRYDEAVQAAVQVSVPTSHWARIYRGLLLRHALSGDRGSYDTLAKQLGSKSSGKYIRSLSQESLAILDAMSRRQWARLDAELRKLARNSRMEFLKLSRDIAVRVTGMDDLEFRASRDALAPFVPLLQQEKNLGKQTQRLDDVIAIFTRSLSDRRVETDYAVRGGVTHAGRTSIRPIFELRNPFQWVGLDQLPLEPLLAMPDGANTREWTVR